MCVLSLGHSVGVDENLTDGATVSEAPLSADPLGRGVCESDTSVRANVVVYTSQDFQAEPAVSNTMAGEAASAGGCAL